MRQYDEIVLKTFIKNQTKLFDEPVAETLDDADMFLEECLAVVCKNIKEVKAYFDDNGMDLEGMSLNELKEASEVFPLPDGRFLVVEG